jgi:hypothetical protein
MKARRNTAGMLAMTLFDFLRSIRERLIQAIDQDDRKLVGELKITLTILREASYDFQTLSITSLIVALEDIARDGVMGFALKSEIPSVEMLRSAFLVTDKS